ncbi:MAG TPA: thioredoxin domain-containing protein [Candidatus Dormibacteraeota bacterium]|nr:thioredoxin domain-containing protein [Candidatus Dormibacteraeota bacterium]
MNRLADETSPYLRQHQDNPVDWYPWGEAAFARAQAEDRPILLSIGYAACHWCHVMAHESFENPAIAARQNALFVNVKVDREERPDVDAVYMDAVQALTGQGGWPMTVFCLPDGRPFHAGTYFPPDDRHGLPGFPRVLEAVAVAYRERGAEVRSAAGRLVDAVRPVVLEAAPALQPRWLETATRELLARADRDHGGFGGAPKFPNPALLDFLLARVEPGGEGWTAVVAALDGMARGGVYDQLGGGFHRYSVDAAWRVPHFEKMLYDNAQLARTYLHAFQAGGDPLHRRIVEETLAALARDLRRADGGFASSSDADSEGAEGRYFVWTPPALQAVLGAEDGRLAQRWFGVTARGNVEGGASVLWRPLALEALAGELGTDPGALQARLDRLRQRLLEARGRRAAPARDDKCLVGWNALAVRAFAEAGAVLGRPDLVRIAEATADLLWDRCWSGGRLAHVWHEGQARFDATLEDVAALALACLELYQATFAPRWLAAAGALLTFADGAYRDRAGPGWFDVPEGHDPRLPVRPRSVEDGAVPSGTALMVEACWRWYGLTGEARWAEAAERALRAVGPLAARAPHGFGALLLGLELAVRGPLTVALVGEPAAARGPLLAVARARYRPTMMLAATETGAGGTEPAVLRDRPALAGAVTAYCCRGFVCERPTTDPGELARQLDGVEPPAR